MSDLLEVVLGALLHDIGKPGQRAGAELSSANREAENMRCRLSPQGYYTHRHVLWTGEGLDSLKDHLPQGTYDSVTRLAMGHHVPGNELETIVAEADNLSAGGDRIPDTEESEDFRTARLVPIFGQVNLEGLPSVTTELRYPLVPLKPGDDSAFPRQTKLPDKETARQEYLRLWQGFLGDGRSLDPVLPPRLYVGGLVSMLEHWFANVPSASYGTIPDITLFDHAYTTAAIAQALYRYHEAHESLDGNAIRDRSHEKFLLLSLDLSGIQKFIFSMGGGQSRGAAKILRGRSAFLWLLEEAVGLRVEEALELLPVARLAEAGGKAYYLLPNLPDGQDRLQALQAEVEGWMWKRFHGALALNLAWIAITPAQLESRKFNRTLDRLGQGVEQAKRRSFASVLKQSAAALVHRVDPSLEEMEAGRLCPACERQPGVGSRQDKGEEVLCSQCQKERELGRSLLNGRFVVFTSQKWGGVELPGYEAKVVENPKVGSGKTGLVLCLNGDDHLPYARRWMANYVARFGPGAKPSTYHDEELADTVKEGEIKTFGHLAVDGGEEIEQGRLGIQRVAMLKADVDRLGHLFGIGLRSKGKDGDGSRLTISRYAGLSRMLGFFFTAHLTYLQEKEGFGNTYTVFSGGDDLCLVGPWQEITRLALRLREDFRRFTCRNPHVTISAGITLFRPRQPVKQAAADAEVALEHSKDKGRDRITLFRVTSPYDSYAGLLSLADDLRALVATPGLGLGSGFLHALLELGGMRERAMQGSLHDAAWRAMTHYHVARNVLAKKAGQQVMEMAVSTLAPFLNEVAGVTPYYRIPLTWAMLANRKAR